MMYFVRNLAVASLVLCMDVAAGRTLAQFTPAGRGTMRLPRCGLDGLQPCNGFGCYKIGENDNGVCDNEFPGNEDISPMDGCSEAAPVCCDTECIDPNEAILRGTACPVESDCAADNVNEDEAPPPPDSNGDFEGLAVIDIASGATVRLTHMGQETVNLSEYPEGLGIQAEFLDNDLVESVTFETDAGYSHTEFKFTYDMFGTNGGGAWPDLIPGRVTLTVTARFTDGNEAQHETVIDFEGAVPDRGFEE